MKKNINHTYLTVASSFSTDAIKNRRYGSVQQTNLFVFVKGDSSENEVIIKLLQISYFGLLARSGQWKRTDFYTSLNHEMAVLTASEGWGAFPHGYHYLNV